MTPAEVLDLTQQYNVSGTINCYGTEYSLKGGNLGVDNMNFGITSPLKVALRTEKQDQMCDAGYMSVEENMVAEDFQGAAVLEFAPGNGKFNVHVFCPQIDPSHSSIAGTWSFYEEMSETDVNGGMTGLTSLGTGEDARDTWENLAAGSWFAASFSGSSVCEGGGIDDACFEHTGSPNIFVSFSFQFEVQHCGKPIQVVQP